MKAQIRGVQITTVEKTDDIRSFFDRIAIQYSDQHGNPARLLKYRLKLIKSELKLNGNEILAEICCGTGDHLIALSDIISSGIGILLSEMISAARKKISDSNFRHKLMFRVDDATSLNTFTKESVDSAICIGSLEHIPDKGRALTAIKRILKPGGKFVCLTVNGEYIWHKKAAPLLEFNTRHLSSDHFLTRREIKELAVKSGLRLTHLGCWRFIPRGDMPLIIGFIFQPLDYLGRALHLSSLRGGLFFTLEKNQ